MNLAHKIAPPRHLTHVETHDSLTQFKFHFNNFYRKDDDFKPLLKSEFTWNGSQTITVKVQAKEMTLKLCLATCAVSCPSLILIAES